MMAWNFIIKIFDEYLTDNYLEVFIFSIIISLLIGFSDEIGYKFSASRIITFFPYFLLGHINKNVKIKDFKINKYKNWIIGIVSIISITYFIVNINVIKRDWLYGSYSYKNARI